MVGLSLVALRTARAATATGHNLQPEAFFEEWQELTELLFASTEVEESLYLHDLNRLLARFDLASAPERIEIVYDADGIKTGPVWSGDRIFVVELDIDPNTEVRAHNHPSHAGTSVGLRGICEFEHFQIDDNTPPSE